MKMVFLPFGQLCPHFALISLIEVVHIVKLVEFNTCTKIKSIENRIISNRRTFIRFPIDLIFPDTSIYIKGQFAHNMLIKTGHLVTKLSNRSGGRGFRGYEGGYIGWSYGTLALSIYT